MGFIIMEDLEMRRKSIVALMMATSVALGQPIEMAGGTGMVTVLASQNENGGNVVSVGSGGWDSFMEKIGSGADYYSVDILKKKSGIHDTQESELYEVKVEETGILYITTSPIDGDSYDYTSEPLFSGKGATVACKPVDSEMGSGRAGGNRYSYRVNPGTYYYKVVRENGHGEGTNTFYTYVGFQADGQKLVINDETVAKVNKIKAGAKKISGSGRVGAKIVVKTKGVKYTAKVSRKGKWSVKVPKLKDGQKVKIYAKFGDYKSSTNVIKAR